MLRCAITDLSAYRLDSLAARRSRLEALLQRWVVDGVDFIQLREKDLDAGALFALSSAAVASLAATSCSTRPVLLLNGRADIAAAAGVDGLHLTTAAGGLTPVQVRSVLSGAGRRACQVSASCHSLAEVDAARSAGVDLILFGPVFEKRVHGTVVAPGSGLARLGAACEQAAPVPVLALGGVTAANAQSCLDAGARGIASIRLFA